MPIRKYAELYRTTTPFNKVSVHKNHERVDLEVEGATFATWHPAYIMTGYSWDAITAATLLRKEAPASVLMLGLAGGTVARQLLTLLPDVRLVAVEIDGELVEIAKKYMNLGDIPMEIVVDDAYAYINKTTEQFDVVIDDLFLTGVVDVMRSKVPSGAVLQQLLARLKTGGVLVANMITDDGHFEVRDEAHHAFQSVFSDVRAVLPPQGLNEVLLGTNGTLVEKAHNTTHLAQFASRLTSPHDLAWWEKIRVMQY